MLKQNFEHRLTEQIREKSEDFKKIENFIKNQTDRREAYVNHFSYNNQVQRERVENLRNQ